VKRLRINRDTPAVVYLKIRTYVGSATVYWAKHWQGALFHAGDRDGVEVTFAMSQADADAANKEDGPYDSPEDVACGYLGSYHEGSTSTRFLSKESLLEAALACWQKQFPNASVLIEGEPGVIEPQPILVGPQSIKDRINSIWELCEKLGWWDSGNEDECEKLSDEWQKIWLTEIEPLADDIPVVVKRKPRKATKTPEPKYLIDPRPDP
jgi:hypothetical protein